MKEIFNNQKTEIGIENLEVSCGNCWGHQEYQGGYVSKTIDLLRGKKDNFISRFVKKYIKKG